MESNGSEQKIGNNSSTTTTETETTSATGKRSQASIPTAQDKPPASKSFHIGRQLGMSSATLGNNGCFFLYDECRPNALAILMDAASCHPGFQVPAGAPASLPQRRLHQRALERLCVVPAPPRLLRAKLLQQRHLAHPTEVRATSFGLVLKHQAPPVH